MLSEFVPLNTQSISTAYLTNLSVVFAFISKKNVFFANKPYFFLSISGMQFRHSLSSFRNH